MSDNSVANKLSPIQRILSVAIRLLGLGIMLYPLAAIYRYFAGEITHPVAMAASFFGIEQSTFLGVEDLSLMRFGDSFISILSLLVICLYAAVQAGFFTLEALDLVRSGGIKAWRLNRQAAYGKVAKDRAERELALVQLPPLSKNQLYEALRALQIEFVREQDALNGDMHIHPAVRERAEQSASAIAELCAIIVQHSPDLRSALTDSYKAAQLKMRR
jgi:hypothetical protein